MNQMTKNELRKTLYHTKQRETIINLIISIFINLKQSHIYETKKKKIEQVRMDEDFFYQIAILKQQTCKYLSIHVSSHV